VVLNVNKKMTLELHKKSKAGYYSVVPLVQPRNQADRLVITPLCRWYNHEIRRIVRLRQGAVIGRVASWTK